MSFTFFDISDMLFYLGHHRNVSGIQRVQSNLVRSVCSAEHGFEDVQFLSLNNSRTWYQVLDKAELSKLMLALPDLEIGHETIRSLIDNIMATELQPSFRPKDIYIITGAFWIYTDVYHIYNKLKVLGVSVGCYIYDLIPINQPDFCTKDLTLAFTSAFNRGSHFFDFMLTISDHTRSEVDEYISVSKLPETVTATVRLAHTMNDHPPSKNRFDLGGLKFNRFVLCVGTIEARKNHQLLYQVWKLLAEADVRPMPKLVIVGRWGWRVDDLKAQLSATNGLDGSIVILPQVDDETLELLYRECSFTIFPSFVEGWGLPVGESLVHERFCLASHTSSIPEVGGRFVDYIDPYNARSTYETVRKYLISPALLDEKHQIIRSEFVARTWNDFRDDLLLTASRCVDDVRSSRKPPVYPTLRFGEPLKASKQDEPRVAAGALVDPELAFAEGWDVPEDLGRWMRGRTARFAFRLDPRTVNYVVELALFSVPWASGNTIHVSCHASRVSQVVPPGTRFDVSLDIEPPQASDKAVEIVFELTGDYDHTRDSRNLCVGLASLSIRPRDRCPLNTSASS